MAQKCHKQMRLLIYQLRQPELREHGLIQALERRLDAVERHSKVKPVLRVHGALPNLPPDLEEQLFFVAQEALNNALWHANATSVAVDIRAEDESIMLMVQDNGVGFDPGVPSRGLGLSTMRDRAESLQGSLSMLTAPGEGTIVEVVFPLPS
jgi:signal transduction histidine kinase